MSKPVDSSKENKQTSKPILIYIVATLIMTGLTYYFFASVINVNKHQYSDLIYNPKQNIEVALQESESSNFIMHKVAFSPNEQNQPQKEVMLLKSPYGKFSVQANRIFEWKFHSEKQSKLIIKDIHSLQCGNQGNESDVYKKLDNIILKCPEKLNYNSSDENKTFFTDGHSFEIDLSNNDITVKQNEPKYQFGLSYDEDSKVYEPLNTSEFTLQFDNHTQNYMFLVPNGKKITESGSVYDFGNRFLKLSIIPISNEGKTHQITLTEYKVVEKPDSLDNAYKIDIFAPNKANAMESFLIPKEQNSIVFSKRQREEKAFFNQITTSNQEQTNSNIISVEHNKQSDTQIISVSAKDVLEKSETDTKNLEKLYNKAVGKEILSQIDQKNRRLYVTGVVLENFVLDNSDDADLPNNANSEQSNPQNTTNASQIKNQQTSSTKTDTKTNYQNRVSHHHLSVCIKENAVCDVKKNEGTEYTLRPINNYLSEYIDGSRYTVYGLSKDGIRYLSNRNAKNQHITFEINKLPEPNTAVGFLTAFDLKSDINSSGLDTSKVKLSVITKDGKVLECSPTYSEIADTNQIFAKKFSGQPFGLIEITRENITNCHTNSELKENNITAFRVSLPIGVCPPNKCGLFKHDEKNPLDFDINNTTVNWNSKPVNSYHRKQNGNKAYTINKITLADGTVLAENGKTIFKKDGKQTDNTSTLGLLSLIGRNQEFGNHLLGFKSTDERYSSGEIQLSIHKNTQEKLQKAVNSQLTIELKGGIFKKHHKNGFGHAQVVAVVMNAKTGEILAAADSQNQYLPKINWKGLEVWDNGYPHTTPYLRWSPAYQNGGSHETTGSSVKLFTSLSILDYAHHLMGNKTKTDMEGLITGQALNSFNSFRYSVEFPISSEKPKYYPANAQGSQQIEDKQPVSRVSMAEAIAQSSNTYFAWLHEMISPALLYTPPNDRDDNAGLLESIISPRTLSQYTIANGKTAHKLGYDRPINLLTGTPEPLSDTMPTQSWRLSPMTLDIYDGITEKNVLNERHQVRRAGIGVGRVHLTPMHLASLSASVSQGKTIYPRLTPVSFGTQTDDQTPNDAQDLLQALQAYQISGKSSLFYVRQGMQQAVTSGTATVLNINNLCVYAKTGTAPVGRKGQDLHNLSIAGFAYQKKPNTNQTDKKDDCTNELINHPDTEVISFACTVRFVGNGTGGGSCGSMMKGFLINYFTKQPPKETTNAKQ